MATKRLKPKFGDLSPIGLEFIPAEGLQEDLCDRILGDTSPTFHGPLIKRWLQCVFSLFIVRCSILDSQVVSVSRRLLRISDRILEHVHSNRPDCNQYEASFINAQVLFLNWFRICLFDLVLSASAFGRHRLWSAWLSSSAVGGNGNSSSDGGFFGGHSWHSSVGGNNGSYSKNMIYMIINLDRSVHYTGCTNRGMSCRWPEHVRDIMTKNIKKEIPAYGFLRRSQLASWICVPLVHLKSSLPYATVRLVESNMISWTQSGLNVPRVYKVASSVQSGTPTSTPASLTSLRARRPYVRSKSTTRCSPKMIPLQVSA
jgi:hypothetical protein